MSIYQKNISALAECYPEIDTLIEKARNDMETEIQIYKEKSSDGEWVRKIEKDGRKCYLNGKRNTKEPIEVWLESIGELITNAPVFIMGVGNSLYLSELVKKTKDHVTIMVFEPSLQIFIDFLENTDITGWLQKQTIVFWVKGIEMMGLENMRQAAATLLTFEVLPYYRNLVLPNYEVLFPDETLEFLRICRKAAVDHIMMRNTQKIFANVMAKNLFSNAKFLLDGYKTTQLIQVIPRDIPGILVAAGPSLNKNIKDLKKACGKALIIAVDTAVKPLIREGIMPDLIMIIDAVKPVELFKIEGSQDIPLVSTVIASSEVLEYHKGKKFFFNGEYAFTENILLRSKEAFGTLSSGGSVATNAFSLLHKIGMTRIILVGQDLAYTNNRTHADGTFSDKMEEVNTRGMYMVEGNCEEKVPIAEDLKQFLDWYNNIIPAIQERVPDFHVINATEGGAKIKNTEVMTLKDAIERECSKEVDIRKCLDQLKPMLDEQDRKWAVEYLKKTTDECNKLKVQANRLKKDYQKLDRLCSRKHMDSKEYVNTLKRIEKGIQKLESLLLYQIVDVSLSDVKYIIKREEFMHESSLSKEGKEIARKGILYMKLVGQCGEVFQQYVQEVYKDLE